MKASLCTGCASCAGTCRAWTKPRSAVAQQGVDLILRIQLGQAI
jgi:Fe-S-cluster-containing dehydrogenase component